jgi:hypothetical protein
MDTKIVGEGSIYPWSALDADNTSSGWREKLQAAPAAEYSSEGFLVGDRL